MTAIALASSVTASATPERRQYPPTQSCQASTGSLTCCLTTTPFTGLSEAAQSGLLGLGDPNLNLNLPVGLDCVLPGLLGWYCTPRILNSIRWLTRRSNNQAFCCSGVQSGGQ